MIASLSNKKFEYFAVYDYGMGGIWFVFRARSKNEIVSKYPFLTVVDKRPYWMDDKAYEITIKGFFQDIDCAASTTLQKFAIESGQNRNWSNK